MARVPRKFAVWAKRLLRRFDGDDIQGVGDLDAQSGEIGVFDSAEITGQRQIRSADDLPDPEPSSVTGYDETHQLDGGTGYTFTSVVSTPYPIELGYATPLRGRDPFLGGVVHTGGETAIVARDTPVWLDGHVVSAPGGEAFDIAGDDQQDMKMLNLQVADPMGMGEMESCGVIDGMRVPVVSDCNFEDSVDGLRFTGDSDKIFVSGTPFRGLGGPDADAAIKFDLNATTEFIKVSDCFFRDFDSQTAAISVDDPTSVEIEGKFVNNDFGTFAVPPIDGVDRGDSRWNFSDNTGVQDSSIRGGYTFQGDETITINQQAADRFDEAAYETVTVAATANEVLERVESLVLDGSTLRYTGVFDAALNLFGSGSFGGTNATGSIALFVNESIVNSTIRPVELRPNQPTSVDNTGQVDIAPDDEIDVRVANLDGTGDITVQALALSVAE